MFTASAYLLLPADEDEGFDDSDSPALPMPIDLDNCGPDDDIWYNPCLRLAPVLPFATCEAGLLYVCQCLRLAASVGEAVQALLFQLSP